MPLPASHQAPASLPPPTAVNVLNFKPLRRGTLIGFVDVHIPRLRMKLYGLDVHQKGTSRWCNLPGRPVLTPERTVLLNDLGRVVYQPTIEFDGSELRRAFSDRVIEALFIYSPAVFASDEFRPNA